MDPEALKNLSGAQKEELMRNVQQQVALANMQELLTVSLQVIKQVFFFYVDRDDITLIIMTEKKQTVLVQ